MFEQPDSRKKNMLLLSAMLLLVYLAWAFSFKNAIAAWQLNRMLKSEQVSAHISDSSFPFVTKKNNFYNTVIKSYRVNSEDREGYLWQSLSGIAMAIGLEISFEPAASSGQDTLLTNLHILKQNFSFRGKYFQMLKLLDSVNKTPGIGRASGFQLTDDVKPGGESTGKLKLKLELSAVTR